MILSILRWSMIFKFIKKLPEFKEHSFRMLNSLLPEKSIDFRGSQAPIVVATNSGVRVYFSARDNESRSHPFYYDLDFDFNVIGLAKNLDIPLGEVGAADEDGIMPSYITENTIYYTGWNKVNRNDVRFRTACMSYNKALRIKNVLIDRTQVAPCGSSMPFFYNDVSCLFMNFLKWENNEPFYSISSKHYDIYGGDCNGTGISLGNNDGGFARPTSISLNGGEDYLFFSRRGKRHYRTDNDECYKLKYVKNWYYDNASINDIIIDGDDNPMKAYAYPIKIKDKVYIFYNSGQPSDFRSPIHIAELIDA